MAPAPTLPLPEARENMEEIEWQIFVTEWKEYKREKRLAGDGVLDELWLAMSKRLLRRVAQSFSGKNETELLLSMKNHAVTIHPRIQSLDLLMTSPPAQFFSTLQGRIPNTSFSLSTTNDELLKEIVFCFILYKFKGMRRGDETDDILALVKGNQIQTSEELVAYFQAEEKKKTKRPRSHSRSRSQSRGRSRGRSISSILKNRSGNKAEETYGQERGRKRMKGAGEESRMMTRSRSRAAGAKCVRILSPSNDRSKPDPTREKLQFGEPSSDIPQPQSKAKMRQNIICKKCGK